MRRVAHVEQAKKRNNSHSQEWQSQSLAGQGFGIQQEIDMTLRDQGFRFVKRGADFKWVHPADVQPSDVDCSDMSDDEFAAFVAKQ